VTKKFYWKDDSKDYSIKLHSKLKINNNEWHKSKGDKERRAAELLSAALVQLTSNGSKDEVEELVAQSLRWLKGEIKDTKCPNH